MCLRHIPAGEADELPKLYIIEKNIAIIRYIHNQDQLIPSDRHVSG